MNHTFLFFIIHMLGTVSHYECDKIAMSMTVPAKSAAIFEALLRNQRNKNIKEIQSIIFQG